MQDTTNDPIISQRRPQPLGLLLIRLAAGVEQRCHLLGVLGVGQLKGHGGLPRHELGDLQVPRGEGCRPLGPQQQHDRAQRETGDHRPGSVGERIAPRLDSAQAGRLVQAAQVLPGRVAMPAWIETEMEMYVRVLASLLVSDAPPDAARLGGGRPGWAGGLRRLSPCPEQQRWEAGLHLARELQGPLRWATASWGGRFGLQRQVNAAGLGQVEVVSLEYVMTALNAAWRWDLRTGRREGAA